MTVWTPGTSPLAPQTAVWSDADNYRGPKGAQGERGVPGEGAYLDAVRFTRPITLGYTDPTVTYKRVYTPAYVNLHWHYGQQLRVYHDADNYMIGTVEDVYFTLTPLDAGYGADYVICIHLNVSHVKGSGTYSTWFLGPDLIWSTL